MKDALTLSLVIPVYNEDGYLKACLDSVAAQTVKPKGVIVVDNNSTDGSVEIAKSYPFVTLIHEKRQHQAYAQAAGFDHATGDILGRIDGDCVLPASWVETVLRQFEDANVAAITGSADPYDAPLKTIAVAVFNFYSYTLTKLFSGKNMIWNSNAAFRSKYWPEIKQRMRIASDLWEDHEMAYYMADYGQVKVSRSLKVGCSFRSVHKGFFEQLAYQYRAIRVFGRHNNKFKTVLFFFAWYTMIPIFMLAMIDKAILKLRHKPVH